MQSQRHLEKCNDEETALSVHRLSSASHFFSLTDPIRLRPFQIGDRLWIHIFLSVRKTEAVALGTTIADRPPARRHIPAPLTEVLAGLPFR
jgi:hypothetical protein